MREGSQRSTGLLSVYYCPLSAPSALSPLTVLPVVRSASHGRRMLQRPIFLCPPRPFSLTLAAILPFISFLNTLLLLQPSFFLLLFLIFSYTPYLFFSTVLCDQPLLLLFFPLLLYYYYFPPHQIFYLRRPYPLKRRPCARVRCAHGATKQKGEKEKTKVVIRNILLSLYSHFCSFLSPFSPFPFTLNTYVV